MPFVGLFQELESLEYVFYSSIAVMFVLMMLIKMLCLVEFKHQARWIHTEPFKLFLLSFDRFCARLTEPQPAGLSAQHSALAGILP